MNGSGPLGGLGVFGVGGRADFSPQPSALCGEGSGRELESDHRGDGRRTHLALERFLDDLGDVGTAAPAAHPGAGLPGDFAQRAGAVLDGALDLAIRDSAAMANEHGVRPIPVRGDGILKARKMKINVDFTDPGEKDRRANQGDEREMEHRRGGIGRMRSLCSSEGLRAAPRARPIGPEAVDPSGSTLHPATGSGDRPSPTEVGPTGGRLGRRIVAGSTGRLPRTGDGRKEPQ